MKRITRHLIGMLLCILLVACAATESRIATKQADQDIVRSETNKKIDQPESPQESPEKKQNGMSEMNQANKEVVSEGSRPLPHEEQRRIYSEFEIAVKQDHLKSYERFLNNNPKGTYSDLVRKRVEQLRYAEAKFKDTLQAYQDFSKRFPQNPLAKNDSMALEILEGTQDYGLLPLELKSKRPTSEEIIRVTLLNKTGITIRMLVAGEKTSAFSLAPQKEIQISVPDGSVIVLKDVQRTFRAHVHFVHKDADPHWLELWLAPEGKYQRELQIVRAQARK